MLINATTQRSEERKQNSGSQEHNGLDCDERTPTNRSRELEILTRHNIVVVGCRKLLQRLLAPFAIRGSNHHNKTFALAQLEEDPEKARNLKFC